MVGLVGGLECPSVRLQAIEVYVMIIWSPILPPYQINMQNVIVGRGGERGGEMRQKEGITSEY